MKNHPVLYFLIFTCFLVIGYTFSLRFYQPGVSILSGSVEAVTSESHNSLATMENGQRSILLVRASSLKSQSPVLESMWLATYLPSDTAIQLLPIYPSGKKQVSDFEKQLDLSFGINKTEGSPGLDPKFVRLLEKSNYWWSGYVIFDDASLVKIFDMLGGVDVNGKTLSGVEIVEALPEVLTNPESAYSSQMAVLQAFCHELSDTELIPEIDQLFALSSSHILSDLDANQLQMEWETLNSTDHDLTCRFPTLEISRIEP